MGFLYAEITASCFASSFVLILVVNGFIKTSPIDIFLGFVIWVGLYLFISYILQKYNEF
jgi:hypothetical protein